MSENQATLQALEERSQRSTFSRREFLQITFFPLTIAPRRQQTIKLPDKYPAPPFHIGDTVADEWVDEFEIKHCEIGEIVGICWHPINGRWEYQINWLSGKSPDFMYPCFDNQLTCHVSGAELRLA